MMSGKRWGYVVQFFCLLVFLGMSPFLIKMDGRKTMSVSSDSVRSQNVSDEVKPVVALTFDDGPNASSTPILLDGLKERKVRATFFLIGENVEKDENEKIVKRMFVSLCHLPAPFPYPVIYDVSAKRKFCPL